MLYEVITIETGEIDFRSLQSSSDEYSQPVVRLIDSILTDAVKRDASDIHFVITSYSIHYTKLYEADDWLAVFVGRRLQTAEIDFSRFDFVQNAVD